MNINDLTVCLYTSTKGHFGRKDIYKTTALHLLGSLEETGHRESVKKIAHVKVDPGEDLLADEMFRWLKGAGFLVIVSRGEWKHGDESHQVEYIKDQMAVNDNIKTQFLLHLEDDWVIKPILPGSSTSSFLLYGMDRLSDPNITQVRIPRYTNEPDRIRGLMVKHGIDGRVSGPFSGIYLCNDWSNNPFIARTRDIRAALTFVTRSTLPKHSEHGVGKAMSLLGWSELPFAFFDPEKIRCYHLGTPAGLEDNLDADLIA